jgi:hypothetical protein
MNSNFDPSGNPDETGVPLCDIAGLSRALAETTPQSTLLPQGGKEHRTVSRYIANWKLTAAIDSQSLLHGYTKDISIKGAAILLEQNLKEGQFIKLHIYIPPPAGKISCIIEVVGKVVYSIYAYKEQRFRVGASFLKFATEHDPVFLENHLQNNAPKALI